MVSTPRLKSRDKAAAASTAALPPGTLVYCLRGRKQVAARLPSGEVRILLDRQDGAPFDQWRFQPYGAAYDSKRRGVWMANKVGDEVWFLQLTQDPLKPLRALERHPLEALKCPCALEFNPDYGLLAACYGKYATVGGVLRWDGKAWQALTVFETKVHISHACWLPGGGFAYVTRPDSVLWCVDAQGSKPRALTAQKRWILSEPEGLSKGLRLQYVQGLCYSHHLSGILIADATLGAIFLIDTKRESYRALIGVPCLADSSKKANVKQGAGNVFLGPVRALTQDEEGRVVWLDGEAGNLFSWSEKEGIRRLGATLPRDEPYRPAGAGITRIAN